VYVRAELFTQRILPFLVTLLDDSVGVIRATAVLALRSLLAIVVNFTTLESNLFQYYVFPALSRISKDSDAVVRIAV